MSQNVLKPAATKLPLAVRKDIRDEWDANRPQFERDLSDMLGKSWTITTDPNLIYANAADETYTSRLGQVISWYIEPLVGNVKSFVDKFGEDGKKELNSIVASHTISFGPQDSTEFIYGGLVIENSVLRLVYKAPDCFAVNVSDISEGIAEALEMASSSSSTGSAYNILARNGVREDYDPKIEEVRRSIETLTGLNGIVLKANFEENAAALNKNKETRDDWKRILGEVTLAYFDSFAYQLKRAGFEGDDMLQEGFQDAVTKGEISLQVVETLANGSYHDIKTEDGILLIQTTPTTWWVNMDDVGSNILDIL